MAGNGVPEAPPKSNGHDHTPKVEEPRLLAEHEFDDRDAHLAAYDEVPERDFTGPSAEGNLAEFEALTPPGKSAGSQKLDQLNPQRKDDEQRAPARRKTTVMSESAEGTAANGAPHEAMSGCAEFYGIGRAQ